jgi:hypothetical protein
LIELKLRLLADKVPSLVHLAHANKLENIETGVAIHFATVLSKDEKTTLTFCRNLRNKILHCNFSGARERLGDFGAGVQPADVRKIDLAEVDANKLRAKVEHAIAENQGELVSETTPKQSSIIFGWLIEANAAGDFINAVQVFQKISGIVDRLASMGDHSASQINCA